MTWDQVSTMLILSHAVSYPTPPYRDADGHHCHVRRDAPDVAAAIIRVFFLRTCALYQGG